MRDDTKVDRQAQIEQTALEVLARKGYDGASMLTIAKAAKASNETLYRWYGDKAGLFGAIVTANAAATQKVLDAALCGDMPPATALERLGPVLLSLLLGDRSVLLNRAAASDPTGVLGAAIARHGRETVFPRIVALMQACKDEGKLACDSAEDAAGWYLSLLVGDMQVRRIIGTQPPLRGTAIAARSEAALAAFWRLYD